MLKPSLSRSLALLALLSLAACAAPELPKQNAEPAVLVQAAIPPGAPAQQALGRVRAAQLHLIASESGGRVARIEVDVGERVRRGQLLLQLDAAVALPRLAAARKELARAEAQLADRSRHRARVASLLDIGAASDADAEQAEIEYQAAQSGLAAARTELAAAGHELDAVQLRAPVDGAIAARHIERSAVAAPGAVLLEIDGDGAREIVALAPAAMAGSLQLGALLHWHSAALRGRAVVERIASRANGPDAREIVARVVEGEPQPGAIVVLELAAVALKATAQVPAAAVLSSRDGARSVRVLDADRRVREVPVELLQLVAGGALVAGELTPGTLVLAAGGQHVAPGTRVQPRLAAR